MIATLTIDLTTTLAPLAICAAAFVAAGLGALVVKALHPERPESAPPRAAGDAGRAALAA